MSETIKFITDSNLGKLAKWLRILGYDTTCYTGDADRRFLSKAQKEGRFVLTRKKDMAKRQFAGKLAVIQHDHVQEQLEEVIRKFSIVLEAADILTICIRCNEKLTLVSKEDVIGLVPEYTWSSHSCFYRCPRCEGIFWPGTHKDSIDRFLMAHRIPSHHL
jgi:uncharacterized protein